MVLDRLLGAPAPPLVVAVLIDGPLDFYALDVAWRTVQRRHPYLRLRVDASGRAEFVDEVRPLLPLDASSQAAKALDAARHLVGSLGRPRDLGRESPVEGVLLAESPHRHVLVLAVDHACADAWALGLIARELGLLYSGKAPPEIADPTPLVGRFALAERAHELQRAELSLREEMRGARTWAPSHREGPESFALQLLTRPVAPWRAATRAARRRRITPFALGLALFGSALSSAGAPRDLVIAAHVANRGIRGGESLVAASYETSLLRVRPRAHGVADWMDAAIGATSRALDRQALPLGRARELLDDTGPLQLMYGFDQHPFTTLDLRGLNVRELPHHDGPPPEGPRIVPLPAAPPAALAFSIRESWQELQLFVHYDRRIGDATAQQLLAAVLSGIQTFDT